jgi:hypothetical protein
MVNIPNNKQNCQLKSYTTANYHSVTLFSFLLTL